jgi:hypothetical protein
MDRVYKDRDAIRAAMLAAMQPGGARYYREPHQVNQWTEAHPLPPYVLAAMAGAMASEDWQELTFETPTRQANPASDVLVPALQAAISGGFAGIGAGIGATVAAINWAWPWWAPVAVGAVVWVVASGAMWGRLLDDSRRLLRKTETIRRRDEPQAQTQPADALRIEVIEDRAGSGKAWTLADLPTDRATLTAICRGVASGARHLSSRDLAAMPGLSRDKARELLADLEARGFVAYPEGRNHPDGAQWTARGKALSRALVGGGGGGRVCDVGTNQDRNGSGVGEGS